MSAPPDERTPLIGQSGASEEAGGVGGGQQDPESPQPVASVPRNVDSPAPPPRRPNAEPYGLVALLIFIIVIVVLITFLPRGNPRGATEHIISAHALTQNIFEHLNELMNRAKAAAQECGIHTDDCAFEAPRGHVSRSVLTGYNSSATYVYEKLKNETHCEVNRQDFRVPVWEQVLEPELSVTFFTRLGCDKEEPGKGDPGKGDPGKGDPGKGDPDKGKPGKGKPDKGKPGKGEPDKGKPGKGKRGKDEPDEDEGNPPNGNDTDTFVAAMFEHDLEVGCNGTYYVNNTIVFKPGFDFWQMRNGGQTHALTGQQVYNVGNGGCHIDAQWQPQIENRIALVEATEDCTYWDVAYKAQKAGASAVVFYKPNSSSFVRDRVRIIPWQDGDPVTEIPVLFVSSSVAQLLATARDISNTNEPRPSLEVSLRTNATLQIASTYNLICDWAPDSKMNKSDTVVFGAHLDSVPEGPGMVDNGSGSMTLLEIVLALDRAQYASRNPFKFIWWGAEELGSLGATHYVRSLAQTGDLDDIAAYLNFDMLGSSNWIPMILNGGDAPPKSRNASEKVTQLFADFFIDIKHKFEYTGMVSGTDFVPFLARGIPCGGLYTGSSEIKNVSQVPVYGGMADVPLDTCYHKACDQVENVNYGAIELMSQATLHAVTTLAQKRNLRQWLNTPPEKSEPED